MWVFGRCGHWFLRSFIDSLLGLQKREGRACRREAWCDQDGQRNQIQHGRAEAVADGEARAAHEVRPLPTEAGAPARERIVEAIVGQEERAQRHAVSRWSGHTNWRGLDIYYRSSREMRAAFASGFAFRKRASIGWGDHQLYVFRRRT